MVLMLFSILGQCSTCITPDNIPKDNLWNIRHIQDSGSAQPDKKNFFATLLTLTRRQGDGVGYYKIIYGPDIR